MSEVLYEVDGPVATVTLNRPERLNAMTPSLLDRVLEVLELAAADDDVRAVVLTGAGRGFCAGGDLAAMSETDYAGADRDALVADLRRQVRSSELLRSMPKVTIAAVNGPCAGAGLSWACAADLRIASASAVFRTAFLSAGLSGDFGGSWTLPRIVGPARARELYLRNPKVSAQRALELGLVAEVVADDELLDRAAQIAAEAAEAPPLAVGAMKANLDAAERLTFAAALDEETARHIDTGRSGDAAEAARAFVEKRVPAFRGA